MTKASAYTKKWREKFKARDPEGYKRYRSLEFQKLTPARKHELNLAASDWARKNRTRVNTVRQKLRQVRGSDYRASQCLKEKYGITLSQKQDMLAGQGGRCAICGTGEPPKCKNGQAGWTVDHCHEYEAQTGGIKIRSILCLRCNSLLGMAQDREEILVAALQYLQKHRS